DPGRDCTLLRYDLDVGKHGDTGASELEVLQALKNGKADAGALAASTWARESAAGRVNGRVIWTSPGYCHCNFTALAEFPEELGQSWTDSLLKMRYEDPCWRSLMDQEGLRRWIAADPVTMQGYQVLAEAVDRQGLA